MLTNKCWWFTYLRVSLHLESRSADSWSSLVFSSRAASFILLSCSNWSFANSLWNKKHVAHLVPFRRWLWKKRSINLFSNIFHINSFFNSQLITIGEKQDSLPIIKNTDLTFSHLCMFDVMTRVHCIAFCTKKRDTGPI